MRLHGSKLRVLLSLKALRIPAKEKREHKPSLHNALSAKHAFSGKSDILRYKLEFSTEEALRNGGGAPALLPMQAYAHRSAPLVIRDKDRPPKPRAASKLART